MRGIYRVVRFLRVLPRRLFGRSAPKFVSDIYAVVKYGNFIELIPTVAAIVLHPRHFFRRLPRTLAKKGPFLDPVHFVLNAAAFATVAVFWVYPRLAVHAPVRSVLQHLPDALLHWAEHATDAKLHIAIAIFAVLTPVWILPLCAFIYALVRIGGGLFQPDLETDKGRKRRRGELELRLVLAPLSPGVYLRLKQGRFACSLCYYGIVAFLLIQLVAAAFLAGFYQFSRAPRLPNLAFVFLFVPALIAEGLLVAPYIELLRWSCHVPPIEFQRAECIDVRVASEILLKDLLMLRELRTRWDALKLERGSLQYDTFRAKLIDDVLSGVKELDAECGKAASKLRSTRFYFRDAGDGWLTAMNRDQTRALREAMQLKKLKLVSEGPAVPQEVKQRIRALRYGRLLTDPRKARQTVSTI